MKREYTSIVIGAGPAGIFAGMELGKAGVDTILIEKGKPVEQRKCPMTTHCYHCNACHEIEGIGGAGGYSDGKLCNGPVGIATEMIGVTYDAEAEYVNQAFRAVLGKQYVPSDDVPTCCSLREMSTEITEVVCLGTTNVRYAFESLHNRLSINKVTNQEVMRVSPIQGGFAVWTREGVRFRSKYLVVATGKGDFSLYPQLTNLFQIKTEENGLSFGVRLEISNRQASNIKAMGSNPKIKKFYERSEYVKTHCFCYGGEVVVYACGPYMLVGGRSDAQVPTPFANMNVIYKSSTSETYSLIIETMNTIADRFPNNVICQDVQSFLGEPSNGSSSVRPGNGEIMGDLAEFYPDKILYPLRDFIKTLVAEYGLDITGGLVHGPAVEWIKPAIDVSFYGESSCPDLFFVGDTSGKTQGIVSAAVMGVRAGQEIVRREQLCRWNETCQSYRYLVLRELEKAPSWKD